MSSKEKSRAEYEETVEAVRTVIIDAKQKRSTSREAAEYIVKSLCPEFAHV